MWSSFWGQLYQDEWFRHIVLRDSRQEVAAGAPPLDLVCIALHRVAVVAEADELGEGARIKHPFICGKIALSIPQAVYRNHAPREMVRI